MLLLHVYCIEYDEWYWFVAENPAEAEEMLRSDRELQGILEVIGDSLPVKVTQEPDGETCAIIFREDSDPQVLARSQEEIDEFLENCDEEDLKPATLKTWGEWAREKGKGFFTSTV